LLYVPVAMALTQPSWQVFAEPLKPPSRRAAFLYVPVAMALTQPSWRVFAEPLKPPSQRAAAAQRTLELT